jgi:chemotaxis response regulator CheB
MSFPIVGIGASAGGLESIFALLAGIPASTGMAYVFVQHLDPAHGSHLAKILSKRTALPVEEAREGEIFPDHLYVIIPNSTLTITSRVLHLRSGDPAERPHRPIDILFLSLAEKSGPNVIGPLRERVRRSKRYLSNQRGRWDYFRGGEKFCLLFWDAKQRHPNGMRGPVRWHSGG